MDNRFSQSGENWNRHTIMRHSTSKKLFNYWNNLRGNRIAPERTEIEPSDIRDILGDTFILEVDHTYRTVSFRLAGTKLCSAYGRELKNVGYLGLWDEVDNMKIYSAVKEVYQNFQPMVIAHVGETEQRQFLTFETLLVPLSNQSSQSVRILGITSPAETPSWIGIDPLVNNRIKLTRKVEAAPILPFQPHAPALSEELPSSLKEDTAPRKVGHLTIFDGGLE